MASKGYRRYLHSAAWKARRRRAIELADGKCSLCGDESARLEVHHNTYERFGDERPSDLIVLCRDCHRSFHGKIRSRTRTPVCDLCGETFGKKGAGGSYLYDRDGRIEPSMLLVHYDTPTNVTKRSGITSCCATLDRYVYDEAGILLESGHLNWLLDRSADTEWLTEAGVFPSAYLDRMTGILQKRLRIGRVPYIRFPETSDAGDPKHSFPENKHAFPGNKRPFTARCEWCEGDLEASDPPGGPCRKCREEMS